MKIAHLVNIVPLPESGQPHPAYLHVAQPLTLKSMSVAREMAKKVVDVALVACRHKNELVKAPDEFIDAPCFERYCYEVYEELRDLENLRPLPLLVDLLQGFSYVPDADWCVFTNVDIGVHPHFYLEIARFINSGLDSFCINRQHLPKEAFGIQLDATCLPLVSMTPGEATTAGTDCFIFKPELISRLRLGRIFVGYPPIGRVLRLQIEALSERFHWFLNERLTFHLGNDAVWKDNSIYRQVNLDEEQRLLKQDETPPD